MPTNMKQLVVLSGLLEVLPRQDLLHQAASYIKKLRERNCKVEAKEGNGEGWGVDKDTNNGVMTDFGPPVIRVKHLDSNLEIVLISGLHKQFRFRKLLVVNATISVAGDRIFHTINAELQNLFFSICFGQEEMSYPLLILHASSFPHQYKCRVDLLLLPQFPCLSCGGYEGIQLFLGSMRSYRSQFRLTNWKVLNHTQKCHVQIEGISLRDCLIIDVLKITYWNNQLYRTFPDNNDKYCGKHDSNLFLHIQTLRNFPVEKLFGEVVMVRFDCDLLLNSLGSKSPSVNRVLSTITYLHNAGAKILLVSNWGGYSESMLLSPKSVAEYLTSVLQVKVIPANGYSGFKQLETKGMDTNILLLDNLKKSKEEVANSSDFAETLSSGVNIFVNDTFSLSHKILSSTVGVARFCYASIAGFNFEEELFQLMKARECNRKPYMVIVGGGNFLEKAAALHNLASVCDGIIFVGMLAFQVMNALGLSVSSCFVEHNAVGEASEFIRLAHSKGVQIYFPSVFWCVLDGDMNMVDVFPSDAIHTGWTPIDLGPASLKEISSVLSKCKKVLWIGPVRFGSFKGEIHGATELASVIERISKTGCDVTVVGSAACKAIPERSKTLSQCKILENASVVWEFLKGRSLPGVAALDRAYPFHLDWSSIFADASQPLIVDIGSGNGLFILKMARRWKSFNFIGLEINEKLVKRCLNNIHECGIKNGYFISTNATSTFRSIVSSYPGDLFLVSIQCPNPDFNKEDHRWRMVQRTLVEAISDLLIINGKIFLQSDVEDVTMRMKEEFMLYGRSKLVLDGNDGRIEENPFGVRSDWEQHVFDRGAPMFRVMIRKVG